MIHQNVGFRLDMKGPSCWRSLFAHHSVCRESLSDIPSSHCTTARPALDNNINDSKEILDRANVDSGSCREREFPTIHLGFRGVGGGFRYVGV